jgi:hypothetical protein
MDSLQAYGGSGPIDLRRQCISIYLITVSKMTPLQIQQLSHLHGDTVLPFEESSTVWNFETSKNWLTTLSQNI